MAGQLFMGKNTGTDSDAVSAVAAATFKVSRRVSDDEHLVGLEF